MKRILRRRPSPAFVISLIALFVAMGGSAYALVITGGDVKNGSLTGKDLRKDSLTGVQVKESTVGKVPRAKTADRVGSKTAAAVTTQAFFAAQKGSQGFTGNDTLIGKIALPAGSYVISAKLTATNSATSPLRANCSLRAGSSDDRSSVSLDPGKDVNNGVVPLLLAHSQNTPFEASLFCKAEGNPGLNLFNQPPYTTATNAKIAAIRADDAKVLDF